MRSSIWYGSRSSSGSSAARPIATVSCTCQPWMPSRAITSKSASSSPRLGRLICVFTATGILRFAQVLERGACGVEAPADAPERVVRLAQAVDRHRHRLHARIFRRAGALGGEAAPTGRDRALHAVRADGADDLRPVFAEIGLAADEGDLFHAEVGHLTNEVERLLGRELLGPFASCARPAVATRRDRTGA